MAFVITVDDDNDSTEGRNRSYMSKTNDLVTHSSETNLNNSLCLAFIGVIKSGCQISWCRRCNYFEAVVGRPNGGRPCTSMGGWWVIYRTLICHLFRRIVVTIKGLQQPLHDQVGGGEAKPPNRRTILGLACSAHPRSWTQTTTLICRYDNTFDWVGRILDQSISLSKSRGAPLCQCCYYLANLVRF